MTFKDAVQVPVPADVGLASLLFKEPFVPRLANLRCLGFAGKGFGVRQLATRRRYP